MSVPASTAAQNAAISAGGDQLYGAFEVQPSQVGWVLYFGDGGGGAPPAGNTVDFKQHSMEGTAGGTQYPLGSDAQIDPAVDGVAFLELPAPLLFVDPAGGIRDDAELEIRTGGAGGLSIRVERVFEV